MFLLRLLEKDWIVSNETLTSAVSSPAYQMS